MNNQEIESLSPGRQMDFSVAEAMGFKLEVREWVWEAKDYLDDHPQKFQISIPVTTNPFHGISVPHYSTDETKWFELIEYLKSKKINVIYKMFGKDEEVKHHITLYINLEELNDVTSFRSIANTASEALCKALLMI